MCRNTMRLPSLPSQGLTVFLFCLAALLSWCEAAIQCSPAVNDVSYVPDVPASLAELGSTFTELSPGNAIYIYPVSSLSCSGTVTGVDFCYRRVSSTGTVFTLLIFSRTGNVLIVDYEISIPTPSSAQQECSGMTCCGTYTLTNEQFELPEGSFHIGVRTPNSGNRIIGFHSSFAQYLISTYLAGVAVLSNSMINVNDLPQASDLSLRIMRLIIDSSPAIVTTLDPTTQPVTVPTTQRVTVPTTQPLTDPPDTTQGATTPQPTTTGPTVTTDPVQTTDSPETTDSTDNIATTPFSPTNTEATSAPQTADDGIVPTILGVVVAVLAVLLLVTIVVIVACVCKQKRTRHVVVTDGNLAMDQRNESFGYTSSAVQGARDYETVDTDAVTADAANITVNHEAPMYETVSDTPAGVAISQNPAYGCVPNATADATDYGYVNEGMGGLAEMTRCEAYGTVPNQHES